MEKGYEKISPTAWLTAYQRTLSDIPLSEEIFRELEEVIKHTESGGESLGIEELIRPRMSFIWESRFKIVNFLLKLQDIDQILEIASGYSPRGLNLARDPSIEYVEIDLPGVIQRKKRIVEKLINQAEVPIEPNLHLEEGNSLNMEDMLKATNFFKKKPIAIVNEGLLPYLNHEEKTTLGRNIHQLLEYFGGVWITPDISTQAQVALFSDRIKKRAAKIEHLTGIDTMKNRFENEETACLFFDHLGFAVERHNFKEIADELILPRKLNLQKRRIDDILGYLIAFVMRVKTERQKINE